MPDDWATELEHLRWHWGDAYEITRTLGMFRAVRRDDGVAVAAPTGVRLLAEIRADYDARPVPRDLPPVRLPGLPEFKPCDDGY